MSPASDDRRSPGHECVWTVVVGGGTGSRFGGAKQYALLDDRRVLDHATDAATQTSDGVIVVLPASDAEQEGAIAGGSSRSESVRNGLEAVPAEATIVCVHDAARPFASESLFRAVVDAVVRGADGAVPGVPVTDTIKLVGPSAADGSRQIESTPPRDRLVAVQTPQAFRASVLRAAHRSGLDATDDAALVERSGGTVVVVPGDVGNRKITLPEDLDWARARVGAAT